MRAPHPGDLQENGITVMGFAGLHRAGSGQGIAEVFRLYILAFG
jgi:hypothetical protein